MTNLRFVLASSIAQPQATRLAREMRGKGAKVPFKNTGLLRLQPMRALYFASACLLMLVLACSDDEPQTPALWDATTIFDYRPDASAWAPCSVQSPTMLRGDEPCIAGAMKLAGAKQSAIDFYEMQKYFLATFQDKGRIDYGQGGAPWINMGRHTPQLFLNGTPDVIEAEIPQSWKQDASYADILRREPQVGPWLEYGMLASSSESKSSSSFVIEYAMRVCRACPDLGVLPVTYTFDVKGALTATTTGAFKPK